MAAIEETLREHLIQRINVKKHIQIAKKQRIPTKVKWGYRADTRVTLCTPGYFLGPLWPPEKLEL